MAKKKATKAAESIWTRDITNHSLVALAVFGLVVSSFVTTVGVTVLGVQAQVALAQNESVSQTAAAFLGDDRPASAALLPGADHHMGSTTTPANATASSTPLFCPKISRTIGRGASEATTTGDVGQLQQFIANHFGLKPDDVVTGHFGSTTQAFLEKFQQEQGIPPAPTAGPLTRAAIARLCNPGGKDPSTTTGDINRDGHMGSSTPHMMGSTTMATSTPPGMDHHERPQPPVPPKATSTKPVSYTTDGAANAASMVDAMSEIGDGYAKLFQSVLSSVGL